MIYDIYDRPMTLDELKGLDDLELSGLFIVNRGSDINSPQGNIIVCGNSKVMKYFIKLEERAAERSQLGMERLKEWRGDKPERLKELKKLAKASDYLSHPFIALDSEGQDYLNVPINRTPHKGEPVPYEDHRIFLWGAAAMDESVARGMVYKRRNNGGA